MITARNKLYPSIKAKGYFPRPYSPHSEYGILKVFTSTDSHYSIDKATQLLGLGLDNIVRVPTDAYGRMDTNELGNSYFILYKYICTFIYLFIIVILNNKKNIHVYFTLFYFK